MRLSMSLLFTLQFIFSLEAWANMHCQEFFFRSNVNISDVINFDAFNFNHSIAEADISKLPPEFQELLKAESALMKKRIKWWPKRISSPGCGWY